jgi:NDP-sugar pyrophosphorylase family protein
MDVRAVLILGVPSESHETIAGAPYALTDVLGKPVVFHVLERLRAGGITDAAVVTEAPISTWPIGCSVNANWVQATGDQVWRSAEQLMEGHIDAGADIVVILRIGAYTEIDFNELVQCHVSGRQRMTAVLDSRGIPLDVFAVWSSRRNDAAFLLRHRLREFRSRCEFFTFDGYVNRLTSVHDLRTLAIDGLMQRISISPDGHEVKPGVWAGRGAQIHRRARVLSPAFIGAGSRVRAAAVITRCTVLEHHTVVDCGTVVENSSTLPYTYLGAGLDVTQSVVGHSRVWNLKRNVEVEFADSRLIGEASSNAPLRALGSLLSLASFLPSQLVRGLFTPRHRECAPSLPDSLSAPAAALEASASIKSVAPAVDAGEFPRNLVVARRYGNE